MRRNENRLGHLLVEGNFGGDLLLLGLSHDVDVQMDGKVEKKILLCA